MIKTKIIKLIRFYFQTLLQIINPFQFLNPKLNIYTDGSHKDKWGAWAYVVIRRGRCVSENSGRVRHTNSHRMEFQAAIEALQSLVQISTVCIHTDSRVLIQVAQGKNIRVAVNSDQMAILNKLMLKHKITWKWVRAHSGNIYNERCDQLCVAARS